MIRRGMLLAVLLASLLSSGYLAAEDHLRQDFLIPPDSAKPWCYWWWLNGAASKEGITRDFEEMKRQGISGALLFDAGEAGADAPRGPHFMSPEWRELYKHAVREADRCGIALGVNLCSGWNCGGPWVTPEHAAKKLVSAQTRGQRTGTRRAWLCRNRPPHRASIATSSCWRRPFRMARRTSCGSSPVRTYQDYGPALAEDGNGRHPLDLQRRQARHGTDAREA